MDHWQRIFTYITGTIVIGLMLILFTHSFLHYANAEGSTGYITLLIYGFVFLNLGYGVNRRFALKADHPVFLAYLLSFLMAAPTLLWIFTKDEGLGDNLVVFTLTILFAAFLGTFFGRRRGDIRRHKYIRHIYEEREKELPEELKRPHDKLIKN